MEDEIKEILDIFKKINEEYSLDTDLDFEDYEIPNIYLKHFLDYITNLQESEAHYYGQYKDYKSRIDKAIDKIQLIIDYGFDYDGFNRVESLKSLIDMLVDFARQSKDILKGDVNNE